MAATRLDWEVELGRWLKPFLERLGHKARRRMCPLYVAGLIGPGDRKSIPRYAVPQTKYGFRINLCTMERLDVVDYIGPEPGMAGGVRG